MPMVTRTLAAELEGDPHVPAIPPGTSACLTRSPRPLETHRGLATSHTKGPGTKRHGQHLKSHGRVLGADGSSLGSSATAQCPRGLAAEARGLCCPPGRGTLTATWPKLLAKRIWGGRGRGGQGSGPWKTASRNAKSFFLVCHACQLFPMFCSQKHKFLH